MATSAPSKTPFVLVQEISDGKPESQTVVSQETNEEAISETLWSHAWKQ